MAGVNYHARREMKTTDRKYFVNENAESKTATSTRFRFNLLNLNFVANKYKK